MAVFLREIQQPRDRLYLSFHKLAEVCHRVTITLITPSSQPTFIGKALLKAVGKKQNIKAQSGAKTFVLRNINTSTVTTCSYLKPGFN